LTAAVNWLTFLDQRVNCVSSCWRVCSSLIIWLRTV